MNFCLPRDRVEKFVEALKSGELDPEKLANMTSKERSALFDTHVGEGAGHLVNAEFESKLLLKNQNQGFATWIRDVAGLKPEVRRDMLAKVQRLDKVLTPADKKAFLNDLVSHRLGANVTTEEASKIAELSKNVSELEQKTSYAGEKLRNVNDLAKYDYKPTTADTTYGKALADFRNYTGDLKNDTAKLSRADFKGKAILRTSTRAGRGVADLSKSIGASLDNSWFGRQGNTMLMTHPGLWGKEFAKSWKNLGKSLVEKQSAHSVDEATHAQLMSDPMYKQAIRDGLPLSGAKDVFPTSLPEKFPVLGRAFKASEAAYSAAHDVAMLSVYKQLMKNAAEHGVDLGEKNASKNIASLVASMTGAAKMGQLERISGTLNVAFYSLRFLKSNLDQLLLHPLGSGVGGSIDAMRGIEGAHAVSFAQKEAATNLVKVVSVIGGVLAAANALKPGSVDLDPRSTDFGKIRIGDTRFDVSGGKGALITLASRLVPTYQEGSTGNILGVKGLGQYTKSGSTGKITQLGAKDKNGNAVFGSQTGADVISSFLQGKLSPIGGVIRDVVKGSTFGGKPITLQGEAGSLVTPLGISNIIELSSNPHAAPLLAAVLADSLGISTNTTPVSNIKSGIIPTGQNLSNKNMIDAVALYAQAIGTDPETAFNRIFSGQQIKRVDNGTVIVQRMSLGASTAVKKAGHGNNPTMKLDHTIPLQLGGSNDTSNLKLVPTAKWKSYTPVEDTLGRALSAGKISKNDAQSLIQSFKNGHTKASDIISKYK